METLKLNHLTLDEAVKAAVKETKAFRHYKVTDRLYRLYMGETVFGIPVFEINERYAGETKIFQIRYFFTPEQLKNLA